MAGSARVNITPPVGYPLSGYAHHLRPSGSSAVRDSLYARALVLSDGIETLAIVALDLIGFNSLRIPDRIREATGIEHAMLCASHTHSGPHALNPFTEPYDIDRSWPDLDHPYVDWLENQIVRVLEIAQHRMTEAEIGVDTGTVDWSYNRRQVEPDTTRRCPARPGGFVAYYLLKEVPPGTDPLSPENKLIFALGPVTGVPIAGSGRNAVGAKSPLTGLFGEADAGGWWNAELKRAGYDAIIVEGRAERPVYLWIHDGEAEIRDATHLWGKATAESQTMRGDG